MTMYRVIVIGEVEADSPEEASVSVENGEWTALDQIVGT
jgi:hypothetical protein